MASAKHMAKTPEKPQNKHGRKETAAKQGRRYRTDEPETTSEPEDTGKRYKPEPAVKPRREDERSFGKRYKPDNDKISVLTENNKPRTEAPRRAVPTRTITEGGMNRLAARLEERDEKRNAERRAQYEERRTASTCERTEHAEEPLRDLRRGRSTNISRVRLPAHVMKSRARLILTGAAGVLVILIITALLAMPHQNAEPVEAAAEPESVSAASEPAFQQLGDWRLVLVNSEVPLPDDFQMTPTLFDTITVNSKMYPELTALINAAYNDEINLWVASGYRSVEEQESVLDRAVAAWQTA